MAKKDKFRQMQKEGGGALSSFQDIVENAKTVAAIEQQAQGQQTSDPAAMTDNQNAARAVVGPANNNPSAPENGVGASKPQEPLRFMRLPNPQLPISIYNLVSNYCNSFSNMTRQDFVELAIIEKLHNESLMHDDEFNTRRNEIRNRPPRGHRKNTKNQTSK